MSFLQAGLEESSSEGEENSGFSDLGYGYDDTDNRVNYMQPRAHYHIQRAASQSAYRHQNHHISQQCRQPRGNHYRYRQYEPQYQQSQQYAHGGNEAVDKRSGGGADAGDVSDIHDCPVSETLLLGKLVGMYVTVYAVYICPYVC